MQLWQLGNAKCALAKNAADEGRFLKTLTIILISILALTINPDPSMTWFVLNVGDAV